MIDFAKYDRENPQIWEAFKKYAHQAKTKGFKHYSAAGIFEIIRWHTGVTGIGQYKISNNYKPDYARKMMKEDVEFDGFFRTKSLSVARNVQMELNV